MDTILSKRICIIALCCVLYAAGCEKVPIETEEGYLKLEDTELYYQVMGSGNPLMVVHGGPLLDHGYLEPQIGKLSDSYQIVFMDQRLSGRSSANSDSSNIRVSTFVSDIEALREHLDLGKIHLMGHSWGGYLALHYGLEYQENLRSLVLVSPMPPRSEQWQREEEALSSRLGEEYEKRREEILQSDEYRSDPNSAREKLLRLSFRNQFYNPVLADSLRFYLPGDYERRSELFGLLMRDLSDFNLYPHLDTLGIPTLLIYGSQEPGAGIGGTAMDSTLPYSRLTRLDQSGHFSFMESPVAFRDTIKAFLRDPEAFKSAQN